MSLLAFKAGNWPVVPNKLRALLFVIDINNLDGNVGSKVSEFSDDTKTGGAAESEECCRQIEKLGKETADRNSRQCRTKGLYLQYVV